MADTSRVLLRVSDLNLHFGGVQALVDIQLDVYEGELLAVIGPNGAGKTSLLNCINGFYRPNNGSIPLVRHENTPPPRAPHRPVGDRSPLSKYPPLPRAEHPGEFDGGPPHPHASQPAPKLDLLGRGAPR